MWNRLFESLPGPLSQLGISKVLDETWLPNTHADAGLCGGMVFSVMDYYHHHLLPPLRPTSPTSSNDILFQYIRDRLWDSFDVTGRGHRYLGYSSPHYPNGDEGVLQVVGFTRGRSWITYREEWPKIQADIDAGRLSPLGLIQSDNLDIGSNHQVLAYGYEKSGQIVKLYIYDPNYGQMEDIYTFDITSTSGEVRIERARGGKRIYCMFRTDGYTPKMPPEGRRIQSVQEAIRASALPTQTAPYRLKDFVGTRTVKSWLQTL